MSAIRATIEANRSGKKQGVYSICTAHPLVIEAALLQGLKDGTPVLIEATANQVNQFGGYTGMQPVDFVALVYGIADKVGFDREQIVLGGDHLGPVCWVCEPAEVAMAKSRDLIAAYAAAGFKKIHLDTSMPCSDDELPLSDGVIAARAAELCEVAESNAAANGDASDLLYIVGTEVPTPGGASEAIDEIQVTPNGNALQTVEIHRQAFAKRGLNKVWPRVIGLVVQPGVEFDHTSVYEYKQEQAQSLSALIKTIPNLVFEAHSTDYQPEAAYHALVRDHFAILKVGPQLTYALREALFALTDIEDELLPMGKNSGLKDVCEKIMLDKPGSWQKYYPSEEPMGRLYRRYSYSDRIRYYWADPAVSSTVEKLFANLSDEDIPLPLLQQYMPKQYQAIRNGELNNSPRDLVLYHVMQVIEMYAAACWKQES